MATDNSRHRPATGSRSRGNDGWVYNYGHINNDTPGTDDGANPAQWRFAPGIVRGQRT